MKGKFQILRISFMVRSRCFPSFILLRKKHICSHKNMQSVKIHNDAFAMLTLCPRYPVLMDMVRLHLSNRIHFWNSYDVGGNCSLLSSSNGILGSWERFLKAFIWLLTAANSSGLLEETPSCLNVNTWLVHSLSWGQFIPFVGSLDFQRKRDQASISTQASDCSQDLCLLLQGRLCFHAQ